MADWEAGMTTHFVLVDFENVQPQSLGVLTPDTTQVRVFAGASQNKVELGLVIALQPFGTNAEYIQIVGTGKNALEFHIAFYIGELAAKHPDATFTIVSKDTGFDPLIKHATARGIRCKRVAALPGGTQGTPAKPKSPAKKAAKAAAPPSSGSSMVSDEARTMSEVSARLKGMKTARPKTVKTLSSSLKSWSKPPPSAAAVESLLTKLQAAGTISVVGTKVTYNF